MQNLRRISQAVFLLLFFFLFIQTESKGADTLGYPVKTFLEFDPLIFLTTLLSSHSVQKAFFFSLITVAVTLILGRVFCGWVCPLGTLNNLVGAIRRKRPDRTRLKWYRIKYYVLFFLIASSLFTVQLSGFIDPLSMLIRSLSVSVYPLFNYAVRSIFDSIYNLDIPGVVDISESIYSGLKDTVLSFKQPIFNQSLLIGIIFFSVLGLNLVERRFWCRHLCPLGALLGLLSGHSLLKRSVSEGCNECGACASVCQGDARPDHKDEWKISECLYCWNCDDICPQGAVSFGFRRHSTGPALDKKEIGKRRAGIDLERRKVVGSLITGIITVPLLRVSPVSASTAMHPALIRPPGSLAEREFLKRCVRCGECMKVCITNGLQPTLLEAGFEGMWSPVLIPRTGYCEYRCTLCGQVCPTGAIRKLSLDEKVGIKLGLAMIDKSRCLPYAHSTPCIVCEEVCPTPKKAIWFEKAKGTTRDGREIDLKQPRVDLNLCIGCGICEANCPVKSRPAIYVTNIGESRSSENQLLLS